MIWLILIILAVVGYLVYITFADRDKALKKQVDSHGGMMAKYNSLVEVFLVKPGSRILQVTRERIEILTTGQHFSLEYYTINEGINCVDIEWKCVHSNGTTKNRKWKFRDNDSAIEISRKISLDLSH